MTDATRTDPAGAPPPGQGPHGAPRVLVVDDDVTVRSLAKLHLGNAGFEVVTLPDGSRVVETFEALAPDAVLLDVILPDRDGFSLCRELRALPGTDHLPIAMLTSLDDEDAIRSAFEAGATEFLPKPLNWLHETYRLRYMLRAADTMHQLDEARQAVDRGRQEWEQTFAAIDDPLLVLSPELVVLNANDAAARLGGVPLERLIGRKCFEVNQCQAAGDATCAATRAAGLRAPVHEEISGYGPGKRDCLVTASPVLDPEGRAVAIVYSMKDVTEYHRLERELLQAQKMEALGVLAAGVAHDFNNILHGIAGLAEVHLLRQSTAEDLRNGLEEIGKIALKGRVLTNRLLLTSRKASSAVVPVDLAPIVTDVAELLRHTVSRSIVIEASSADGLHRFQGEPDLIHQALTNLAINATQAMPDGGTLTLRAENTTIDELSCQTRPDCRPGPHVVLSVADTGLGMDRVTMEKMYEPFFTTKEPGQGTGLGLSVVYGIVRDHRGHLSCVSEPGRGTTFRVFLPAVVETEDWSPPSTAKTRGDRRPVRGRTVLVADDEPRIRTLVESYLSARGFRVATVANGQEALERYESNPETIDAVVLDMKMPVMGGEECLAELVKRGCRVPILMATGALLDADSQARLRRHAAGILSKPFELTSLYRALADVLEEPPGGGA